MTRASEYFPRRWDSFPAAFESARCKRIFASGVTGDAGAFVQYVQWWDTLSAASQSRVVSEDHDAIVLIDDPSRDSVLVSMTIFALPGDAYKRRASQIASLPAALDATYAEWTRDGSALRLVFAVDRDDADQISTDSATICRLQCAFAVGTITLSGRRVDDSAVQFVQISSDDLQTIARIARSEYAETDLAQIVETTPIVETISSAPPLSLLEFFRIIHKGAAYATMTTALSDRAAAQHLGVAIIGDSFDERAASVQTDEITKLVGDSWRDANVACDRLHVDDDALSAWPNAPWDRDGVEQYFRVIGQAARGRRKAETATHANVVFAEIDVPHHLRNDLDAERAHLDHAISTLRLKPTIIVSSGGGAHLYWQLRETHVLQTDADRSAFKTLLEAWARVHDCLDSKAVLLSQVYRVPTSKNYKAGYIDPRPVEIVAYDAARVYTLDEFRAIIDEIDAESAPDPLPLEIRASDAQQIDQRSTSSGVTPGTLLLTRDPDAQRAWIDKHYISPAQSRIMTAPDGARRDTIARAIKLLAGVSAACPDVLSRDDVQRAVSDAISRNPGAVQSVGETSGSRFDLHFSKGAAKPFVVVHTDSIVTQHLDAAAQHAADLDAIDARDADPSRDLQFGFYQIDVLLSHVPKVDFIIPFRLLRHSLHMYYGSHNSYKTFYLLSVLFDAMAQEHALGNPCTVLYIATEDLSNFVQRLRLYTLYRPDRAQLVRKYFLPMYAGPHGKIDLLVPGEIDMIIGRMNAACDLDTGESLMPAMAIVIDTMRQSFNGSSNDDEIIKLYLDKCELMMQRVHGKPAVIIVDHEGHIKQKSTGPSGSRVKQNHSAVQLRISIDPENKRRLLVSEDRVKNAPARPPSAYAIDVVDVDTHGAASVVDGVPDTWPVFVLEGSDDDALPYSDPSSQEYAVLRAFQSDLDATLSVSEIGVHHAIIKRLLSTKSTPRGKRPALLIETKRGRTNVYSVTEAGREFIMFRSVRD